MILKFVLFLEILFSGDRFETKTWKCAILEIFPKY